MRSNIYNGMNLGAGIEMISDQAFTNYITLYYKKCESKLSKIGHHKKSDGRLERTNEFLPGRL